MSLDKSKFTPRGREISDADAERKLTCREWQVLTLMAQGLDSKQIARHLGYGSYRTIDLHRARIMTKLGARNSVHAAVIAILRGIISLDVTIPREKHGEYNHCGPLNKELAAWLKLGGRLS